MRWSWPPKTLYPSLVSSIYSARICIHRHNASTDPLSIHRKHSFMLIKSYQVSTLVISADASTVAMQLLNHLKSNASTLSRVGTKSNSMGLFFGFTDQTFGLLRLQGSSNQYPPQCPTVTVWVAPLFLGAIWFLPPKAPQKPQSHVNVKIVFHFSLPYLVEHCPHQISVAIGLTQLHYDLTQHGSWTWAHVSSQSRRAFCFGRKDTWPFLVKSSHQEVRNDTTRHTIIGDSDTRGGDNEATQCCMQNTARQQ